MTPQETQIIAQRSLNALSDTRVMVPSDACEALADLKNIMRGLINGTMVLVDRTVAPAADAAE